MRNKNIFHVPVELEKKQAEVWENEKCHNPVELEKNKWKFEKMKNTVGTGIIGKCFKSSSKTFMSEIRDFHECFYNSKGSWRKCCQFLLPNILRERKESHLITILIIKM